MPTGYTYYILKGCTFKEYALKCAHAFGANLELKDKSIDEPIPEYKVDSYHLKELNKAKKELKKFKKLTFNQKLKKIDEYNDKEIENYNKKLKEYYENKKKYEFMLEKVKNYNPPTEDHIGFKKFMKEQIESSMEWDLNLPKFPKSISIKEWENKELNSIIWEIDYHKKEYEKEKQRVKRNNKWNKKLVDSLEDE
jgi:hypothetical protein